MQNVINTFKSTATSVATYLTPITNISKFRETGTITPEEFVAAGDHLVHHCPSWEWATGDESKIKSYLPKEKQFLITRNMACSQRCKQIEYVGQEAMVEEDQDGGWVETHHFEEGSSGIEDKISEMTLDSSKIEEMDGDEDNTQGNGDDYDEDDDDAVDMEDFEESGKLAEVDPATATITRKAPVVEKQEVIDTDTDSVVRTRTYDLHITYDKLYQTPRLWIIGYDENRKLLTVEQMYEDVSQDHAKKTVTMESHPHIPGPNMGSVHPCKHAHVMKKIIQNVEDGGGELGVHMYLIIFLKFVQTVIPTIQYDFTMNFSL